MKTTKGVVKWSRNRKTDLAKFENSIRHVSRKDVVCLLSGKPCYLLVIILKTDFGFCFLFCQGSGKGHVWQIAERHDGCCASPHPTRPWLPKRCCVSRHLHRKTSHQWCFFVLVKVAGTNLNNPIQGNIQLIYKWWILPIDWSCAAYHQIIPNTSARVKTCSPIPLIKVDVVRCRWNFTCETLLVWRKSPVYPSHGEFC